MADDKSKGFWGGLIDTLTSEETLGNILPAVITGGFGAIGAQGAADANAEAIAFRREELAQNDEQFRLTQELAQRKLAAELALAQANQAFAAAQAKAQLQDGAFRTAQSSALQGRGGEANALNQIVANIAPFLR